MIPANLRLMLSLRFSGKNAGVAQKTSENKPDPRTGHAREGVRHPKHRLALALARARLLGLILFSPGMWKYFAGDMCGWWVRLGANCLRLLHRPNPHTQPDHEQERRYEEVTVGLRVKRHDDGQAGDEKDRGNPGDLECSPGAVGRLV